MTGRDLIPAPAPPLEGELLAPNPTTAEFVDAIVRQCEDALDLERGDLMRPPPIEGEVVGKEPRRLSLDDWAEENRLGEVVDDDDPLARYGARHVPGHLVEGKFHHGLRPMEPGAVLALAPGESIDIVTESPPCQDFSITVSLSLPEYTREAMRAAYPRYSAGFCGCGCLIKPLDRECPACGLPT